MISHMANLNNNPLISLKASSLVTTPLIQLFRQQANQKRSLQLSQQNSQVISHLVNLLHNPQVFLHARLPSSN
jgi:hypothetical protein